MCSAGTQRCLPSILQLLGQLRVQGVHIGWKPAQSEKEQEPGAHLTPTKPPALPQEKCLNNELSGVYVYMGGGGFLSLPQKTEILREEPPLRTSVPS